jgi:hypothetical protein
MQVMILFSPFLVGIKMPKSRLLPYCIIWWFHRYQCQDLLPLFRRYIGYEGKQVRQVHLDMVKKHLKELDQTGQTICNSPFLRGLIYEDLQNRRIRYQSQIVGYGRDMQLKNNRYRSAKQMMYHLMRGHLRRESFQLTFWEEELSVDVNKLFDSTTSYDEKYSIINQLYERHAFQKYYNCGPKKTIKRISLMNETKHIDDTGSNTIISNSNDQN